MSGCWRWRSRYVVFFLPLLVFLLLILSVDFPARDLRQIPVVDEPKRGSKTKQEHLVLGIAAGEGLPDRLHCQGLKAMNKTHSSRSTENHNFGDSISFVSVFTLYNRSSHMEHTKKDNKFLDDVVVVDNVTYNKAEKSMTILNVFINFVQVSMPRSKVIVLTDPASEIQLTRNNVAVLPIQGDYSRSNLMLQRIRSYIMFLEMMLQEHLDGKKDLQNYIFTDSDIAVVDDLSHIFHEFSHFHVGLTFRNNKNQPLNSGFIAVRGTPDGIRSAMAFLQEVLDVYRAKYMNAARMLGDQLALAWVVRSHFPSALDKFSKPEAFSGEINGVTVLFLPCALYNWTPPEGAGQFHGMPLNVQVVHFKGSRKCLMLSSWSFFNSTSSLPDTLCLILRSGRTKYDF